jgi:hypothetical protein
VGNLKPYFLILLLKQAKKRETTCLRGIHVHVFCVGGFLMSCSLFSNAEEQQSPHLASQLKAEHRAGQVSPHEFLQAVINSSNRRFTADNEADPVQFWTWLLNALHLGLTGGKLKKSSIITKCFQVGSF